MLLVPDEPVINPLYTFRLARDREGTSLYVLTHIETGKQVVMLRDDPVEDAIKMIEATL